MASFESPKEKAAAVFADIGLGETLSFEEAEARNAIYDRQIRLWGADAQKSIGASRALFCGLGGFNAELVKNLVLAGISVTLQDDAVVQQSDLGANVLLEAAHVGQNRAESCAERARELNDFVTVDTERRSLLDLDLPALAAGHSIVVVERAPRSAGDEAQYAALNCACRANRGIFYYVRCGADGGMCFVDLGAEHTFRTESGSGETAKTSGPQKAFFCDFLQFTKSPLAVSATKWGPPPQLLLLDRLDAMWRQRDETPPAKRAQVDAKADEDFVTFCAARVAEQNVAVAEDQLKRWRAVSDAQLAHVCAVLGGMVGLEIIKGVSKKGAPINNVLVFDCKVGAATAVRVAATASAAAAAPAPPPPVIADEDIL